ncbi:MAG: AI-2E family transporter [Pseudobutyrivibrio sp.]|nr:AI-2E family transporter [Pseudobutyrivibrio sp.]
MPEEKDKQQDKMFRRRIHGYIYAGVVIVTFYFFLRNFSAVSRTVDYVTTVIQPIFIGFIMAFLTNPIMDFLEKRLIKPFNLIIKNQDSAKKINRTVSSIFALVILAGAIIFLVATVVPNLIDTIVYLANNIDEQISAVLDWCNVITKGRYEEALMNAKDSNIGALLEKGLDFVNQYVNMDQSEIMSTLTTSVISVGRFLVNIVIGIFVAIYVLISKETFKGQAKKIICGIFEPKYSNIILEISRKSGEIFYGFIIGKIVDSIIIGIICYIACLIMNMPYPILVSVIVGITNIIPVFGPYIGAIPTVIIIFLTEPMQGIYFLIFIIILQQVDGNLIGPKILGDSTGISSFWVVFAVVVGGGFFGIGGMIIAVPLVAIIYYMAGRISRFLLRRRNLPEDTSEYIVLDHIDEETNTLVRKSLNVKKKPLIKGIKLPEKKEKK